MKRLLVRVLARCGLVGLCRRIRQRRAVSILVYHEIEPALLRKHLKALKQRYRFIGLADYVRAMEAGDLSGLPQYPMVITLDDGHASNKALLEAFTEFGVTPTIFLTSGVIGTRRHFWWKHCDSSAECQAMKNLENPDRLAALAEKGYAPDAEFEDRQALSIDEVTEMAGKVDFQAHTITHPILTMCDDESAKNELAQPKHDLENLLHTEIYAVAYPNGSYGQREVDLARAAGYKCALTVEPGLNTVGEDPYRLKRLCIGDTDDVDKMLLKACGLWQWLKKTRRGLRG